MKLMHSLRPVVAGLLAMQLVSCATNGQLMRAQQKFRQGDFNGASATLAAAAAKHQATDRDAVIVKLEAGSMALTAGNTAVATNLLRSADEAIEAANRRPLIQVGREAGAMLTNLNSLPYVPTPSDQIMGASYLALSFAEEGKLTEARSAVKLAKNRQKDAISKYSEEIEREKAAMDQAREATKVPFVLDTEKLGTVEETIEAGLKDYAPYASYTVPYAELIAGLLLGAGPDAEMGRARESLTRAMAAAPDNSELRAAAGGALKGRVHVLFEEGVAPSVDQVAVHLPLYINKNLVMFSAAYPKLAFHPHHGTSVVKSGGVTRTPQTVCDFDRIAADEFRRRLPGIVSRTTAASILKTTMAYVAQEAIKAQNANMAMLAGIAGAAYNMISAQADRRSWATLPKRVGYTQLPVPSDRSIEIGGETVSLPQGETVIVRVREVAGRRVIRTFAL